MDFSEALKIIKKQGRVYRVSWGVKRWLELGENKTQPFIFIHHPLNDYTFPGSKFPWLLSMDDLLANDWRTLKEK